MDRRAQIQTTIDFTTMVSKPRAIPHSSGHHHHHSVNTSTLDDARSLFSTSPLEVVSDAPSHRYTSNRSRDTVAPSSAPTASRGVPPPPIQTAASPLSDAPSRLSAVDAFLTSQSPHSSNHPTQYAHPHHYNSSQRPQHQRKKSVPWVPDSLAEKCYGCHASFSLVLRRHHCRRCGNVFCDACSSARIPLVSAGFFTPVRVCEKCCVAAKKAHAKMMEEKMQQQQMLRRSEEEYLLFPQTPPAGAALGRRGSVPTTMMQQRPPHQHQRAMTDSVAVASGMFFQQPVHRSHTYEGEMTNRRSISGPRRSSIQFGSTDHLYDDRELDSDGGSMNQDYRMQTLPGEIGMICSENVRIRFMERVDHMGILYLTNYRIVFSPFIGGSSPPSPVDIDTRGSADLSVNTKSHVKEDELPYASDFHTEAVHAYQAINIVSVERLKKKEMAETDSGMIDIVCKDFRHVQFFFSGLVSKQTFSNFDRTYSLIRQHAFGEPSGPQPEFAKLSMESFDGAPDGWKVYNPVAEFQRLGVSSSSRWRISQSNLKYTVCPTYPSLYAVPATVSDNVLAVAAKFRSKSRIPVLSWRDINTGAVICRSSQPLVGLSQKQCDKDVFLIQAIAAANPSSSKLVIIDARPWKNAAAQKTLGRAGYELTDHYETRHATASLKYADMVASAAAAAETSAVSSPVNGVGEFEFNMNSIGAPTSARGSSAYGDEDDSVSDRMQLLEAMESSSVLTECKLLFMGIENIHAMRKSYNKLLDLCVGKQSNDKWLDLLSSTHWLEHISRILESAVEIVRLIKEEKSSVLIHCSDGWDRTAQLTSLAQLMVDPYYRTVQGFQVLIEKEWCSFGHKFRDRTGHGLSNASSEISPVFLQWIDCVWQMMTQFPSSFQFNERYLILILDHLYSCRFGTFLYNSQRARVEEESNHPTVSLWTYLSTIDRAVIVNPFYHPHEAPRKKWKFSVTATRQVFEIPVRKHSKTTSDLQGNNNDSNEERSALELQQQERANRRYTGGESVVHTDDSSLSSSCDGYETDNSEIQRVNENDLDEFINDMQVELDTNKARNGSTQKQPRDFDSEDGDCEVQADALTSDSRSSVFHKIVRDLDAGFSFPQQVEASALSNFDTDTATTMPQLVRVTSAPPRSAPVRDVVMPPASPMISATPPARLSLSALFTPVGGRRRSGTSEAMWSNVSELDLASESDEQSRIGKMGSFEDVIIPCCSMKALHFWTRYYLRWDPTTNFGRDASIEIETLHRDLLLRFETLQARVNNTKARDEEASKPKVPQRQPGDKQLESLDDADDEEDEDDVIDPMFTLDDASIPNGERLSAKEATILRPQDTHVVHLSLNQLLKERSGRTKSDPQPESIHTQIEKLKRERQENIEKIEAAFQEQLSRLMSQARAL